MGIDPRQTQWYRFRYGRPLDDDEDAEGPVSIQPTDAIVTLKMNNAGCISFEIQTPGRLLAQQNPDADDDVRDNPISDAACTYRLSVTGPTVSFGSNPVVSTNAVDSSSNTNSSTGTSDDNSDSNG